MQDGRMPISDTNWIFRRSKSNFVSPSIGDSPLDPATRHPQAETTRTVIASSTAQIFSLGYLGNG